MASRIARIASLPGLLLLVSAASWAGRGDIDPTYGESGALAIGAEAVVALPDDRLAIIYGNAVSVADSNGRVVDTYGDDGQAVVPTPSHLPRFQAWGVAAGPDGRLAVYGDLADIAYEERYEAIFVLDATGHADPAFGGNGDGFFRLTAESYADPGLSTRVTLASFALDPPGRIVLIERTVDLDGACVAPARIRRLLPSGEDDASFGTGGATELAHLDPCGPISIIGVRADSSVVIGSGPHIYSIDPAGGIDIAFGEEGRLSVGTPHCCTGFLLPGGGLLLLGSVEVNGGHSDTILMRFARNGEPDTSFGAGTGSMTIDLAAEFLGHPGPDDFMEQMMPSPDGSGYFVQLAASEVQSFRNCYGIARLASDGRPDDSFGDGGLTCLSFGGYRFILVSVQENGAPVFAIRDPHSGISTSTHRLLTDATPSPGIITVTRGSSVAESAGSIDVVEFARVAGRDGAVSANYTTAYRPPCRRHYVCLWDSATAGSDYVETSGQLVWASGDDGRRTVAVKILNDDSDEYSEVFGVDLYESGGGALLIASSASVGIVDDDGASPTPPPSAPPVAPVAPGGGGSVSWAMELALLALVFIRRRRDRHVAAC
jgi:hypothetical protein